MSFTFRPAKRENVPLLIGLAGGTGSGKTFSALRLATGLSNGKRFAVIDTENGRARHYADDFTFDSADLTAPFRPDAYADAIAAAAEAGYPVVVVDSMSHEWAGDGGLLDWQEELMGGDDKKKLSAWIKPKGAHKKFVTRLLQVNAHVILCFRAQQKVEMKKGADGKWEIVPKASLVGLDGWHPIAEKSLPFELTVSHLLTADAPGLPKPIKLPERLKPFFPLDAPITEESGKALAAWAQGGAKTSPAQGPQHETQSNWGQADTGGASTEWADEAEVDAVLELASRVGDEAKRKAIAAIDKHRLAAGGQVNADWLGRQRAALEKKLPVAA